MGLGVLVPLIFQGAAPPRSPTQGTRVVGSSPGRPSIGWNNLLDVPLSFLANVQRSGGACHATDVPSE